MVLCRLGTFPSERATGKEMQDAMAFLSVASHNVQRTVADIDGFQNASDFVRFRQSIRFDLYARSFMRRDGAY